MGDAENVSALSARRPPVPGLCESLTTASPMAFFNGEVPLEWERAEKLAASQQEHMIESAASTRVPSPVTASSPVPALDALRVVALLARVLV